MLPSTKNLQPKVFKSVFFSKTQTKNVNQIKANKTLQSTNQTTNIFFWTTCIKNIQHTLFAININFFAQNRIKEILPKR